MQGQSIEDDLIEESKIKIDEDYAPADLMLSDNQPRTAKALKSAVSTTHPPRKALFTKATSTTYPMKSS